MVAGQSYIAGPSGGVRLFPFPKLLEGFPMDVFVHNERPASHYEPSWTLALVALPLRAFR